MTSVYYPVGVGVVAVRSHCPLPRRTPVASTTLLLHRRTSSAPLLQRLRCLAVEPHDDDDVDDDFLLTLDLDDEPDEDGSPWEGAVVYRRDAAVQHVEYATTLERLGLADLSSPHSRARAAAMGILLSSKPRATGQEEEDTTPVLVSVDVARRRGRLRLDGIVRTVITLGCYSCAEPAPQGIFANFSLLLTEDPVDEPDVVDLGTVYEEEDTSKRSAWLTGGSSQDDEGDEDIDWDDRLHFPGGNKEIDISKHIRDMIHLEITLDAFCSSTCKGLCLVCGMNLNTGSCSCSTDKPQPKENDKRSGSLKDLLEPMQRRRR